MRPDTSQDRGTELMRLNSDKDSQLKQRCLAVYNDVMTSSGKGRFSSFEDLTQWLKQTYQVVEHHARFVNGAITPEAFFSVLDAVTRPILAFAAGSVTEGGAIGADDLVEINHFVFGSLLVDLKMLELETLYQHYEHIMRLQADGYLKFECDKQKLYHYVTLLGTYGHAIRDCCLAKAENPDTINKSLNEIARQANSDSKKKERFGKNIKQILPALLGLWGDYNSHLHKHNDSDLAKQKLQNAQEIYNYIASVSKGFVADYETVYNQIASLLQCNNELLYAISGDSNASEQDFELRGHKNPQRRFSAQNINLEQQPMLLDINIRTARIMTPWVLKAVIVLSVLTAGLLAAALALKSKFGSSKKTYCFWKSHGDIVMDKTERALSRIAKQAAAAR